MNGVKRGFGLVLVCGLLAGGVWCQDGGREGRHPGGGDRVGIFNTILVDEDHEADDVACLFCTVRVDGTVHGDVAVMFGTVDVGAGREVHGDVATLFSTLLLEDGARVDGDLATALGTAQIAPSAQVRGNRAIFSSRFGLAVIFGGLLVLVGLVWLLVWGVRRVVTGI